MIKILFFLNSYNLDEPGSLKNNEYNNISQLKTGWMQGFDCRDFIYKILINLDYS